MNTLPPNKPTETRKVPAIARKHARIIAVLLGSFIILFILSLFFTHSSKYTPHKASTIPIPQKVSSHHIFNQQQPTQDGNWKTMTVKHGDTLTRMFSRNHLDHQQLHNMLNLGKAVKPLTVLKPGDTINVLVDADKNVRELQYKPDFTTEIDIVKKEDGYRAITKKLPIESRQAFSQGTIKESLFNAALRVDLPSALVFQLVDIFQWDIDFAKDVRPGDTFSVLYDEFYVDGEKVGNGRIRAAEFVNQGKTYLAVYYTDPHGTSGYYTPQGNSLKRRFIRTPVKFTRISSKFTLKRYHPVLHRMRSHKGVDYAAPTGTPVKATANGKIAFRGKKGGYGNAIILQHGKQYSTLYGHMSRFAKGFKTGSKVRQGQVIGYVGMTGLATGPHLHYEFRINNKHHDPLKVKLPEGNSVPKQYHYEYAQFAKRLLSKLLIQQQTALAANADEANIDKT